MSERCRAAANIRRIFFGTEDSSLRAGMRRSVRGFEVEKAVEVSYSCGLFTLAILPNSARMTPV